MFVLSAPTRNTQEYTKNTSKVSSLADLNTFSGLCQQLMYVGLTSGISPIQSSFHPRMNEEDREKILWTSAKGWRNRE